MNELGAKLREAREKRGISLEGLFETTKIQVRLLKALEEGNYEAFPGDVYVRGALRNYADTVGLDYKELSALYQKAKGEEKPPPAPIEKEVDREPVKVKQRAIRTKAMRPAPRRLNLKPLIIAIALLLILYFAATAINNWLSNGENGSSPPAGLPTTDPGNGTEPDTEDPDTGEPVAELALLKANPNQEDYTLQGAENIQLKITFKGECWVRVEEDGKKLMSRTFRNGQTYTLDSDKNLLIRLGYPRGVSLIQVNGLDIKVVDQRDPYNFTITLAP